jgi:hypothetical protein
LLFEKLFEIGVTANRELWPPRLSHSVVTAANQDANQVQRQA